MERLHGICEGCFTEERVPFFGEDGARGCYMINSTKVKDLRVGDKKGGDIKDQFLCV